MDVKRDFGRLGCALSVAASVLAGPSTSAWNPGASVRTIGAGTLNYDNPAMFGAGNRTDGRWETILRITFSMKEGDEFGGEFHLVASDILDTAHPGAVLPARYRIEDASGSRNDGDNTLKLAVDRLNLKFSLPLGDLTVGRQAITFGEAYFWNPLDIFNPFDARSFDRDYKPGVDGFRLDIPLGPFSGLNLVAALGEYGGGVYPDEAGEGDAFIARVFTDFSGWDVSIQGGKVYGGLQLGGGTTGEVGPLAIRGEAAWFRSRVDGRLFTDPSVRALDDSFTVVAGLGYKFTPKLGVEAEYLYNGAGLPDNLLAALERVAGGNSLHMGRNLGGMSVSWEIMPLLQSRLSLLWGMDDRSAALQPGFTYSVSNEVDLLLGGIINTGRRPRTGGFGVPLPRSEFGTNPSLLYAELKAYF